MKVFSCKTQGGYAGGLIIVAAKTKEEAYLTAAHSKKYAWLFEWVENPFIINYQDEDRVNDNNPLHFFSDYYPFSFWREESLLSANVEQSQVITEDHYSE